MKAVSTRAELCTLFAMGCCLLCPPAMLVCWPWLSWVKLREWLRSAKEADDFTRLAQAVLMGLFYGLASLAITTSAAILGVLLWSFFGAPGSGYP